MRIFAAAALHSVARSHDPIDMAVHRPDQNQYTPDSVMPNNSHTMAPSPFHEVASLELNKQDTYDQKPFALLYSANYFSII